MPRERRVERVAFAAGGAVAAAQMQAAIVVQAHADRELARVGHDLAAGQDRPGDVVAQWTAHELRRARRQEGLLQAGPEGAGIGVGADDHAVGVDATAVGDHPPLGPGAFDRPHLGLLPDRAALGHHGAGQPAGIAERIDGAAARIEAAAGVGAGAARRLHLVARQQPQGSAARIPDLDPTFQVSEAFRRMRRRQDARAPRRAVDAVARDQAQHQVGPVADGTDQRRAALLAEALLDLVRLVLQRRHDLAVVAARGAPARLVGIEHQHRAAPLGEVQGGGESGVARADHDGFGLLAAVELGNRRAGRSRRRPIGVGHARRIGHRARAGAGRPSCRRRPCPLQPPVLDRVAQRVVPDQAGDQRPRHGMQPQPPGRRRRQHELARGCARRMARELAAP